MTHDFTDPGNTGRCQARPVYLAIPGAVEAKCLMTAEQHRGKESAQQKLDAVRDLLDVICDAVNTTVDILNEGEKA